MTKLFSVTFKTDKVPELYTREEIREDYALFDEEEIRLDELEVGETLSLTKWNYITREK